MALSKEAATRKDKASGKNAVMQHRHLSFIAAVLAGLSTSEDMEGLTPVVARAFADALAFSNPNFDRARFMKASNIKESEYA